ncbi:MAG: thiamine-phosphate kinase [Bacteroidales bacterium]|jgi:thiamine-monophosphate kinase|nr:thiamine-phosphate kinase [Bacteroidales bacterium]
MEHNDLSTLGEFGLIEHFAEKIKNNKPSTVLGIGDDAAIIKSDKQILITTDLLLQGINFDLTYMPLMHLGYKAAIVNFSDIYAMNGKPTHITVSLGLSAKFSVEMVDELYAGIRLACEGHDVDIIGGDTSASLTGLTISITCIGEGDKDKIVKRSGAKENDLICVTGDLGAAYMGLQLLEREKRVLKGKKELKPELEGFDYILQRQLKPEARKDIIELLAQKDILPTSMIDVSDGLSSELLHICKQSNVGCRIYEERIPIDYQTARMAEEFNLNLVTAALNGGEDYELLFSSPIEDHDKIIQFQEVKILGHITKKDSGAAMIARGSEQEVPLSAQGWPQEEVE